MLMGTRSAQWSHAPPGWRIPQRFNQVQAALYSKSKRASRARVSKARRNLHDGSERRSRSTWQRGWRDCLGWTGVTVHTIRQLVASRMLGPSLATGSLTSVGDEIPSPDVVGLFWLSDRDHGLAEWEFQTTLKMLRSSPALFLGLYSLHASSGRC